MNFSLQKRKPIRYLTLLLLAAFVFSFVACRQIEARYTVVLDPGHGGRYMSPESVYGDKWDPVRGEYLDRYRHGAYMKGIWESEVMYAMAVDARNLLRYTLDEDKHERFKAILKKYTGKAPEKIEPVRALLSRENNYHTRYLSVQKDPNAPYRLYDFPDIETGEMRKGTISRINEMQPNLVVSLHLTGGRSPRQGAMAAVITPGYETYKKAIEYVKGNSRERARIKREFRRSQWSDWFRSARGYNTFQTFMLDAWVYYTGYWSTKSGLNPRTDKYRGHRHNMFSWAYRDKKWLDIARRSEPGTAYAANLKNFKPQGSFWQREQSQPESWRREGGPEGYGGDNHYAANELMRFVRKAFLVNGYDTRKTLPKIIDPYISTWSVPTYVNAISAYLEIGHLSSDRDVDRLLNKREIYAEALAVGVYSLFYSLTQPADAREKDLPTGQAIDFSRYENYKGRNYFKQVAE